MKSLNNGIGKVYQIENNGKDFSFDNIQNFDEHIEQSIPAFKHLIQGVISLASYFITKDSNVYDIGCSTGSLLKQLKAVYPNCRKYIGFDISDNLLPESFDNVLFINQDVTRDNVSFRNANLITSIFTLQFLPMRERAKLVEKIYNNLNIGGAFIVAEKLYCEDGQMQDMFNFCHYDHKRKSFTEKELLDKQVVLREIMKPMSENSFTEMLEDAGFRKFSKFFQMWGFRGWICVK